MLVRLSGGGLLLLCRSKFVGLATSGRSSNINCVKLPCLWRRHKQGNFTREIIKTLSEKGNFTREIIKALSESSMGNGGPLWLARRHRRV